MFWIVAATLLALPTAVLAFVAASSRAGAMVLSVGLLAVVFAAAVNAARLVAARRGAPLSGTRLGGPVGTLGAFAVAGVAAGELAGRGTFGGLPVAVAVLVAAASFGAFAVAARFGSKFAPVPFAVACLALGFGYLHLAGAAASLPTVLSMTMLLGSALVWAGTPLVAAAHRGGLIEVGEDTAAAAQDVRELVKRWEVWQRVAAVAAPLGAAHLALVGYGESGSLDTVLVLGIVGTLVLLGLPFGNMLGRSAARSEGPLAVWPAAVMAAAVVLAATVAPMTATSLVAPSPPAGFTAPAAADAPGGAAGGAGVSASRFGPGFDQCATVRDYLGQKDCYAEYFNSVREETDLKSALDLLAEAHKDPAGETFRNHCHETLHDVAILAANDMPDPTDLFGEFRTICTGGFAHGVLLTYITEIGVDEFERRLPTFCDEMTELVVERSEIKPETTEWTEWTCNHSVGHILYNNAVGAPSGTIPSGLASYDVIATEAEKCLTWPVGDTQWSNCMAGYFMEHFLHVTRNPDRSVAPQTGEEVWELCGLVHEDLRGGCFSEAGAGAISFFRADFPAAFASCTEHAPPENADACYASLGRMVTVYSGFKTDTMVDTCLSAGETQAQQVCLAEVASAIVMELGAVEPALRVCNEYIVDEEYKELCLKRAEGIDQHISESGGAELRVDEVR